MSGACEIAADFRTFLDSLFIDEEIAELTWTDHVGDDPDAAWRSVIENWLDEGLPGWRTRPWAR